MPLYDKGEKPDVNNNYVSDLPIEIDPEDINVVDTSEGLIYEGMNTATTAINGIYGYVNEYVDGKETGNQIWLSLTPYEISPSLADISLFKPPKKYLDKQVDLLEIKNKNNKANLTKAMTIGNRLQAARVVTNYLTEVLNPKLDTRYGSKDNRVGQASRFLDSETGDESDRSAFLHIVPDLDLSNGRIAIPYGVESQDDKTGKRKIDSVRTAFVPVNFNFVHSNYTLTIKEFILNAVNEQNREIYSLDKTFDGNVLHFFGSHPEIISLSGILSNFNDDLIGLEKMFGEITNSTTQTTTWSGSQDNGIPVNVSKRGSMRDTFLSYYQNFLKGTKSKDYGLKIYLYYNWRIIEGFLTDLNLQTSGDNDNIMMFNANMIVKSESSVYEQGIGLGRAVTNNYYSKRIGAYKKSTLSSPGTNFELDTVFSSEDMQFRKAFRDYAIQSTINTLKIGQDVKKNRDYDSDVYRQLLYEDDPYLVQMPEDQTILTTTAGKKLEQGKLTQEMKEIINYNLYKLFVVVWKYNRVLHEGVVARQNNNIALLQDNNSTSDFPYPNSNSIETWMDDVNTASQKKDGPYYRDIWEPYKQQNLLSLMEKFLQQIYVDGHEFSLKGPVGLENITASSPEFRDFLYSSDGVITYITNNWINSTGGGIPPETVAKLSLADAMAFIKELNILLQ